MRWVIILIIFIMASEEDGKLNFYSKYNRVRDKQEIQTLYMLIDDNDDFLNHFDNLVLTLNCSRTLQSPNTNSPIRNYNADQQRNKKNKSNSFVPYFEEQEKNDKFRLMQQKLRKLQKLQKNFHEQLDKSEKQYFRKKQLKQSKKRQREYYRNQLINVVEHTSEHSQQSQKHSIPIRGNIVSSQIIDDENLPLDDYMEEEVEINDQNESDYDVKETKRKLREILQLQRRRQKEVESVQQNNDGKTSSIVIQRLNIMPKINENLRRSILVGANSNNPKQSKDTKNFYEVELNHSQSEKIFTNMKGFQGNQRNIVSNQSQEKYKQSEDDQSNEKKYQQEHQNYEQSNHFQNLEMHQDYSQTNQHYQQNQQYQSEQNSEINQQYQPYEQVEDGQNTSQQLYAITDHYESANQDQQTEEYGYYEQHNDVDPPITLAQGNNQFGVQDTSQINEQINDHVVSIGDLSEQQSQPPVPLGNTRSPLFLSQTSPRKTFQNQHQVQSIAQSLDFHPLQNSHSAEKASKLNNLLGEKEEKSRNQFKVDSDKKNSFKKLMAENRSNLIPRLAISTILNEHINEVLVDYRANQASPAVVNNMHQSIISSEGSSMIKPGKINFKQMLRRSKKNPPSSRDKSVINKDPQKVENNKKLLMNFFDQN